MNLHDWIDELCDALDIDADIDEGLVLDLAKTAAHNVERPAAPVTTFLLGLAVGRADADAEETERLAVLAQELAERWDRPAGAEDDDPAAGASDDGPERDSGPAPAGLDLDFGADDTDPDAEEE